MQKQVQKHRIGTVTTENMGVGGFVVRRIENMAKQFFTKSFQQKIPKTDDPEKSKHTLEDKQKKLLSRKDRYRELYANDLIALPELKAKLSDIDEELKTVDADLERISDSSGIHSNTKQLICHYTDAILHFLELDSITNQDMRQVLDHISVNRDGNVRIVLRKFENTEKP